MVKIKKFNILNREISNNKKKIMEIFLSFIKKDNEGKSLNDLYSITPFRQRLCKNRHNSRPCKKNSTGIITQS